MFSENFSIMMLFSTCGAYCIVKNQTLFHIIYYYCSLFNWLLIQVEENMKPRRPYERHDTLKQFLDHDRHVLRFYCFWDDSESVFGDLRELVLHFFLCDDTIEIHEIIPPNSGRDTVSKFLHRCKLPKVSHYEYF